MKKITMAKLTSVILLMIGLVVMGGCDGEDNPTGKPPSVDVTGHWDYKITETQCTVCFIQRGSYDLRQLDGGVVTGEWGKNGVVPITGLVEDNRLTMKYGGYELILEVKGNASLEF